ncbi:NCAPG [Branchiostoma lanceolatum]|uniref:NCAPG protein n=1 Tax=Branchiostoma lanceolatum TaxID=7740 RepID=A0A8J9Z3Q8_BRALA|nr:NCAPG [Branchiostoma lanceolatum]
MRGQRPTTLRAVFEECQKGHQNLTKLLAALRNIHATHPDPAQFQAEFIHYLKHSLVVFRREPAVERTLEFVAKFAGSFATEAGSGSDEEKENTGGNKKFHMDLFDFLLKSHNANSQAVRFRACQLINKMLNALGEDAEVDDDLYDRIFECMLMRLRDKIPAIRVQAVLALTRLQDPSDQSCAVITAYQYLLGCDPNPDVRRAILSCIAPSTHTLSGVLQRVRDVNQSVRVMAFKVLAEKFHIRALTIAQRLQVLQQGLNDRAEAVREVCGTKLLQSWLRLFEGNILDLLGCLDVETTCGTDEDVTTGNPTGEETIEAAVMWMFKQTPTDELITNFDLLKESHVVPLESLSCESALYWRCLCQYVKSLGTEGEEYLDRLLPNLTALCDYVQRCLCQYVKSLGTEGEEYLDRLLPTLTALCDYVQSHLQTLPSVEGGLDMTSAVLYHLQTLPSVEGGLDMTHLQTLPSVEGGLDMTSAVDDHLRKEFVAQQLMMILGIPDLTDEVGRKRLGSLVHDMLLSDNMTRPLLKLLEALGSLVHDMLLSDNMTRPLLKLLVLQKRLGSLVHDMLLSDNMTRPLLKLLILRYCSVQPDQEARIREVVEVIADIREPITVLETSLSQEQMRQKELKLASIRVQLNEAREEMDQLVAAQEFQKAAEMKGRVDELELSKSDLLEEMQPQTQEVRTEKNDSVTLLRCLTIAAEMLQTLTLKGLSPTLRTLVDSLMLTGIQSQDPAVRNMAVRCLGLTAVLCKDTAVQYLPLFLQASQVDLDAIQVTALQIVFDLLLIFGLKAFGAEQQNQGGEGEGETEEPQQATPNNTANSLLSILTGMLDSENTDIRTNAAEGLAKLMMSGRVLSGKLLSRLLLLWYNPTTEDDTHLRHCLGTFFPMFAFSGRSTQECVEEAFLPTLQTLLDAPDTSPLATVDVGNVGSLLTTLTSRTNMRQFCVERTGKPDLPRDMEDYSAHDNLALKLCNEVLKDTYSPDVRMFCKILGSMEPTASSTAHLKDLYVLSQQITQELDDRLSLRSIEHFQKTLCELCPGLTGEGQGDTSQREQQEGGSTENQQGGSTEHQGETGAKESTEQTQDKEGTGEQGSAQASEKLHEASVLTAVENVDQLEDNVFTTPAPPTNKKAQKGKSTAAKRKPAAKTPGKTSARRGKKKADWESDSDADAEASVSESPAPASRPRSSRKAATRTRVNLKDLLSDSGSDASHDDALTV